MRRLITIAVLAMVAGCNQAPRTVTVPAQSQDQILRQLKADLQKASMVVQEQKVDCDIEWMTHSSARMCSRPLDISLADNKLGAFVHPIQNLSPLTGASLQDVGNAFGTHVEAYLKENQIAESRTHTGDNIGNYMEENAEQTN